MGCGSSASAAIVRVKVMDATMDDNSGCVGDPFGYTMKKTQTVMDIKEGLIQASEFAGAEVCDLTLKYESEILDDAKVIGDIAPNGGTTNGNDGGKVDVVKLDYEFKVNPTVRLIKVTIILDTDGEVYTSTQEKCNEKSILYRVKFWYSNDTQAVFKDDRLVEPRGGGGEVYTLELEEGEYLTKVVKIETTDFEGRKSKDVHGIAFTTNKRDDIPKAGQAALERQEMDNKKIVEYTAEEGKQIWCFFDQHLSGYDYFNLRGTDRGVMTRPIN